MKIHPTVVIGVGSTGKHVVANVEKYLYEVLNAQTLDVFRFIVLETAVDQPHDASLPTGSRTNPVDIKVRDIGAAYYGLKYELGDDFNWCPPDLRIVGAGAGNKRAGGRLMFFHYMDTVQSIIQTALQDVKTAAENIQSKERINAQLASRGVPAIADPFAMEPVVMIVGTLAGGTCSGTCVDLAYLIRKVQPTVHIEGVFFFPDDNAIEVFKANSWAALTDLIYFTENPSDYHAVWLNSARNRVTYSTTDSPAPPYTYIYLLSQRDQSGNLELSYDARPGSPLLMMAGVFLAADLLGLNQLRQELLVNLNTRVANDRVFCTLLTNSLRGVSYPKYEISEAAACHIIAAKICGGWLDKQQFTVRGKKEELKKAEINKLGRQNWNEKSGSIWKGLSGYVDIPKHVETIKAGHMREEDVREYLISQFSEKSQHTIYSEVEQNVEGCYRLLQNAIRTTFTEVLQQNQNLKYAEYCLEGIRSEILRTRKYFEDLGVPPDEDRAGWQKTVRDMVEKFMDRKASVPAFVLGAKREVMEDELNEMVSRLEMFLMHKALQRLSTWVDETLQQKIERVRRLLQEVQALAETRAKAITDGLDDNTGPLLKISRSEDKRFKVEIDQLAKNEPGIKGSDYISYDEQGFTGILPFGPQPAADEKERIFLELKSRVQPVLIQQLQAGGAIDIVSEIERQGFASNAVDRAMATQRLSMATKQDPMVGKVNVPSFLLAKSEDASTRLHETLRRKNQQFPDLASKELPFFDHVALFYQEGAKLHPDFLRHAEDMKRAYETARQVDAATVDPLRLLKTKPLRSAGQGPSREDQAS